MWQQQNPLEPEKTLPIKNADHIRADANAMLDKLWRGRGGFIAGWYSDTISIDIEPEWQQIASDEFAKQGVRGRFVA